MMYMNGDGVGPQLVVDPVELLFENRLRYDAAQPTHQMLENCAFASGQQQRRFADANIPPDRIECDIAGPQGCAKGATRTPQQSLCAGDQLGHGEGLDQIVVGSGIEPADAV